MIAIPLGLFSFFFFIFPLKAATSLKWAVGNPKTKSFRATRQRCVALDTADLLIHDLDCQEKHYYMCFVEKRKKIIRLFCSFLLFLSTCTFSLRFFFSYYRCCLPQINFSRLSEEFWFFFFFKLLIAYLKVFEIINCS